MSKTSVSSGSDPRIVIVKPTLTQSRSCLLSGNTGSSVVSDRSKSALSRPVQVNLIQKERSKLLNSGKSVRFASPIESILDSRMESGHRSSARDLGQSVC